MGGHVQQTAVKMLDVSEYVCGSPTAVGEV
jgi:hypothetical protein